LPTRRSNATALASQFVLDAPANAVLESLIEDAHDSLQRHNSQHSKKDHSEERQLDYEESQDVRVRPRGRGFDVQARTTRRRSSSVAATIRAYADRRTARGTPPMALQHS